MRILRPSSFHLTLLPLSIVLNVHYINNFTILIFSYHRSLKESVYKAMHPILCEYVGFQEAEITPLPDGTATVALNLASQSHLRLGMVVQTASWKRINGFFLTSSSVGVLGSE